MNEHYELSVKLQFACPKGVRTLCPDGPDTLSGRPGQLVRVTRSTCPDDPFKVSGEKKQRTIFAALKKK